MAETSTKPYLIRAIYEWCNDNGYTPYLAVAVDERTQVPREHVKAGEIVLNVSPMATNRLSLGNDVISFQARFGGMARELSIPIENVSAIYARENGHGMAFDVPKAMAVSESEGTAPAASPAAPPPRPLSLAPARAPVLDLGAPAGPASDGDAGADPAKPDTPPEGPGPEGGAPRTGRPRLTRIK
ncbi:MAG: ClpXP protease specificity-enhancing factor [Burkholderiales bacterium]|nr:MAG: ClpXP protease specificity-enhancing factor [Burkholderiales bacterium]